jgi:hypothetical protein
MDVKIAFLSDVIQEEVFVRQTLGFENPKYPNRVRLMCDNTSAIFIAKMLVLHKRMRHLERRHHFLRDHVKKGDVKMSYNDTERQLADIFNKPLDASHFAAL